MEAIANEIYQVLPQSKCFDFFFELLVTVAYLNRS